MYAILVLIIAFFNMPLSNLENKQKMQAVLYGVLKKLELRIKE